ncbi:MAG: SDR family NAD(P)-dependent oxidoreductase [Deltaproteobacteria bacterium]|nr:SDR family NAD(P)-dependent oxidoreductase [Deltaproteobacteria bacterium]
MNFDNPTIAFVTGANRGIGAALVDALLTAGATKVYAGVRDAAAYRAPSPKVTAVALDVTDPESCERAAKEAGDVNLLINNAGTLASFDVLDMAMESFDLDLATNFFGPLHMARAFVPVLRRGTDPALVNVLTVLSVASMPGMGGYAASKAATWSLTMSLRHRLAADGIRVHGVFPGPVDTDMLADVQMPKTPPSAVAGAIVRGVIERTEDIAPDPMSEQVLGTFMSDPKAVERQFGAM